MGSFLYDLFARRFPSARATPVIETSQGRVYTYEDLASGSARFAEALRHYGVAKGDRVLAQVEQSPEALFLYLGCLRLCAIFVPLNPGYRERELSYFLADAEPRALVCAPAVRVDMERLAAGTGGGTRGLARGAGGPG